MVLRVDVFEEDDAIVVEAELPGVAGDAIDVWIEGDRLVIDPGAGGAPERRSARRWHRRERPSPVRRTIPLPHDVDPRDAQVRFEAGLLRVVAPIRCARAAVRHITLDASRAARRRELHEPCASWSSRGSSD